MFVYLPGKKYTNLINLCFRKMDSTPKNLMWKCFDKGDEKRKILERELPDGFEYIVNRFKIVEESSVPHESKFEAGFLVKVCDEEKQDEFIKSFECSTGTNFNLKWAKKKPSVKNWKHKLLKCSRNVREQMQVADTKMAGKGAGSGRVKGVERQLGKNQDCQTSMSITLRPCKVEHCEEQCFNLSVDLVFDHSHEVESTTTAWNFLEVEESARLRLIELFEEGLTPSRAKKAFEEELMAKYGDDWLEVSAKRSINQSIRRQKSLLKITTESLKVRSHRSPNSRVVLSWLLLSMSFQKECTKQ